MSTTIEQNHSELIFTDRNPQALIMEVLRPTEIGPLWIISDKFIPSFE
jgi:hypothetical protein